MASVVSSLEYSNSVILGLDTARGNLMGYSQENPQGSNPPAKGRRPGARDILAFERSTDKRTETWK